MSVQKVRTTLVHLVWLFLVLLVAPLSKAADECERVVLNAGALKEKIEELAGMLLEVERSDLPAGVSLALESDYRRALESLQGQNPQSWPNVQSLEAHVAERARQRQAQLQPAAKSAQDLVGKLRTTERKELHGYSYIRGAGRTLARMKIVGDKIYAINTDWQLLVAPLDGSESFRKIELPTELTPNRSGKVGVKNFVADHEGKVVLVSDDAIPRIMVFDGSEFEIFEIEGDRYFNKHKATVAPQGFSQDIGRLYLEIFEPKLTSDSTQSSIFAVDLAEMASSTTVLKAAPVVKKFDAGTRFFYLPQGHFLQVKRVGESEELALMRFQNGVKSIVGVGPLEQNQKLRSAVLTRDGRLGVAFEDEDRHTWTQVFDLEKRLLRSSMLTAKMNQKIDLGFGVEQKFAARDTFYVLQPFSPLKIAFVDPSESFSKELNVSEFELPRKAQSWTIVDVNLEKGILLFWDLDQHLYSVSTRWLWEQTEVKP